MWPQNSHRHQMTLKPLGIDNANFVRHCLGKNHQTTAICNNCRRPVLIACLIVSMSIHKSCHIDFQDFCTLVSKIFVKTCGYSKNTSNLCLSNCADLPALHCIGVFYLSQEWEPFSNLWAAALFFSLSAMVLWSFSRAQC